MTPDQEALLRKAHESCKAAQLLLENKHYDFAISRAYYTMFYVASALLLDKGLTFSKHSGVVGGFGQHFTKTGLIDADYHRYLLDAQAGRNKSDYDAGLFMTESQAKTHIEHAQMFLELAEKMIGPLP